MAAAFQVTMIEGVPVFAISGYVDERLGKALNQEVSRLLRDGTRKIIFEFSGCPLINSLGISQILEIAIKTNDDFQGILVLVAVPKVVMRVLTLAGVVAQAKLAENIPGALALLKAS